MAGYGTGAIMAVPCGDERDLKFAKHFNIPVTNIIGEHYNGEEANPTKDAILGKQWFLKWYGDERCNGSGDKKIGRNGYW